MPKDIQPELELGQVLFATNTLDFPCPDFAIPGLTVIAQAIANLRKTHNLLVDNSGEPPFSCLTFTMRSYCWCDGEANGHEQGCPPNFQHKDGLAISWYKHAGRSPTANRSIVAPDWDRIVLDCLQSLATTPSF